jgi:hypothetical protein
MRIAYLTTDEVNRHLVEEMAAACGLTLCPLAPRDPPPGAEFDAVLYDWDYWPVQERGEVMAELLEDRRPHAVALHGYNLEDALAEPLRRHTVAVYRRLHPRVFRFLRRAVRAVRAGRALGHNPQGESVAGRRSGAARVGG